MRVVLAHKAWDGISATDDKTLATCAIQIPWIEIDGRRYENVVAAKITMEDGVTMLDLKLIAAVEVVLLGREGQVL